jgi:hypothetical protein
MRYTAYVLCEPGMDRPCFSHTPPSEEQKKRIAEKGTKVFLFELLIPGVEFVDGELEVFNVTPFV